MNRPPRRCSWCGEHPDYQAYHDDEWGFPVDDDRLLFEKLSLEGFQSGLSWLTILRKRDNFRRAFREFDFDRVARWSQRSVERLLRDQGIVRHRGKIEATISNARCARSLREEWGSLGAFFWSFEPDRADWPIRLNAAATSQGPLVNSAPRKLCIYYFIISLNLKLLMLVDLSMH